LLDEADDGAEIFNKPEFLFKFPFEAESDSEAELTDSGDGGEYWLIPRELEEGERLREAGGGAIIVYSKKEIYNE
jgi:hypothetical protein